MGTSISHSPAETEALGEQWGREVLRGSVIALCGDLGAGKTRLVKGLARGLGVISRVHSPTFALVNCYAGGRLPLFHLDLYRLDNPEMVLAAGLQDYLEPEGVSVIEWAERWFTKKPAPSQAPMAGKAVLRWVELEVLNDTDRRIYYDDFSP